MAAQAAARAEDKPGDPRPHPRPVRAVPDFEAMPEVGRRQIVPRSRVEEFQARPVAAAARAFLSVVYAAAHDSSIIEKKIPRF